VAKPILRTVWRRNLRRLKALVEQSHDIEPPGHYS